MNTKNKLSIKFFLAQGFFIDEFYSKFMNLLQNSLLIFL